MSRLTRLCRRIVHVDVCWRFLEQASAFREFFLFVWERVLVCSTGRPLEGYRRLSSSRRETECSAEGTSRSGGGGGDGDGEDDEGVDNLVPLKISLLGDCRIGKTSFVVRYVGDDQEKRCLQMTGLNLMDKTVVVQGARISFTIWDVGGDHDSLDHLPIACKDAVAILIMFDLTSRCTLNSVIGWYSQARKWNKTAIPILIGTKFDDFVQLPPDLQWTVITQARAYARAMKATLFFSSSTHNINVNKIFKFIMAKLFNLPWTIQRNLTVGEPIVDF
ncbi:hypothetical protein MLD38_022058 [Melastoma candidum]|uniref:Uncharacterized protein n=1 Tax=Melastoma candidum TaxID=119954 RepID=A0ACB9QLF3_9MYRT|nr:hypothetical protein MLD38_022058 [Melastoma candidum]